MVVKFEKENTQPNQAPEPESVGVILKIIARHRGDKIRTAAQTVLRRTAIKSQSGPPLTGSMASFGDCVALSGFRHEFFCRTRCSLAGRLVS